MGEDRSHPESGETAPSGDTGTYFKTEDGVVYVILSDAWVAREAAIKRFGSPPS